MNKIWQNNILQALEKEASFDLKKWYSESKNDDHGLGFMENVAYYKNVYDYLNQLGLINTGFCPITGEKIDNSFNYSIFGRTIFVSEKALELGKEKKQKFREQFQKENPNFDTNIKQAKSFVEKSNPNSKKTSIKTVGFVMLFLSGYLSYTIIKPETFFGYFGVITLFLVFLYILWILFLKIAIWLKK